MTNVAMLIGNTHYQNLQDIACCYDDLRAMEELLGATKKFSKIKIIENAQGDNLKSAIRQLIEAHPSPEELFFYYTGHGHIIKDEFYFCAHNFDQQRPNETGMSNYELHTLLRQASAGLVVKVIDSCNSGTSLIKRGVENPGYDKSGFNNLIQISSCLESQNSLTGDPLSFFTDKFINSALRKEEGPVYYLDIINSLRDEFIQNEFQTPHFISQVTGREKFVEDAGLLKDVRMQVAEERESTLQVSGDAVTVDTASPNLVSLLEDAEDRVASSKLISSFIGGFLNSLTGKCSNMDVDEYFELRVEEHATYQERVMDEFMARMLSREKRIDEFVTAKISRERKRSLLYPYSSLGFIGMFRNDKEYEDVYEVWLNMKVDKAQVCISMIPKFSNLEKIMLIVSCAPSLERCYIFELIQTHRLSDLNEYHEEGRQVVRHWYKRDWNNDTGNLVDNIFSGFSEVVNKHLNSTRDRLLK